MGRYSGTEVSLFPLLIGSEKIFLREVRQGKCSTILRVQNISNFYLTTSQKFKNDLAPQNSMIYYEEETISPIRR